MARLLLLDDPDKLNSSGTEVHVTGIGWAGGYGEPADSRLERREVPAPSGAAMAMRDGDVPRSWAASRRSSSCTSRTSSSAGGAASPGYRVVVEPGADVLHEYEYGRNPRKSYFLERNRLVFVLSAYSARLLVLLGPLLVVDGARDDGARAEGGLARETSSRAGAGSCGTRRSSRRRRRTTQGLRTLRDRDLSRYLTRGVRPCDDPGTRVCCGRRIRRARATGARRKLLRRDC